MANGDISNITIRADGWSADVLLEGWAGQQGNVVYAYGLGANNDTTNAKFVLAVVSQGFNAAGGSTTANRTVYGTQTVRLPYPNEADLDEVDSGGNLVVRVALSEYIYDADAFAIAAVGAGWVQVAAESNAVHASSSTISSALAYPKVIGHFAVPDRVPVNGITDIEVFAVQAFATDGKPVAMVKITATGADSSHVETSADITDMTLSGRGDLIPVYAASMDLSVSAGFTLGEVVTIDFTAYPWVGDAGAVLNSTTDAGTQIFQLNPLTYTIMNKMIAVVDGVGGGTPVASESQAAADAAPFATQDDAIVGIAAQNNSDHSLNRLDGGEIQLKAGTYKFDFSAAGASTNGYHTTTIHSSTTRAGVIFDGYDVNRTARNYMRFFDVTITRAGADLICIAGAGDVTLMESVDFADSQAILWYSGDADSNLEFLDCTYNSGRFSPGASTGHSRLHRNCTYTATNQTTLAGAGNPSCLLGLKAPIGGGASQAVYYFWSTAGLNNKVIGYCKMDDSPLGLLTETVQAISNIAIVNNLIERVGASQVPILSISAGGGVDVSNIVLFNNSFAGRRFNHENDLVAPFVNGTFTNYIAKNNIFNARGDHRADIDDEDALMVGTWPVGYSVGWSNNHNEAIDYGGDTDFWGLYSNIDTGTDSGTAIVPAVPAGYVVDASRGGTDLGNGDYHLDTGSPAIGQATEILLPFDIEGTVRFIESATNGGAAGAYEFGEQATGNGGGLRGRYAADYRDRYSNSGRH